MTEHDNRYTSVPVCKKHTYLKILIYVHYYVIRICLHIVYHKNISYATVNHKSILYTKYWEQHLLFVRTNEYEQLYDSYEIGIGKWMQNHVPYFLLYK